MRLVRILGVASDLVDSGRLPCEAPPVAARYNFPSAEAAGSSDADSFFFLTLQGPCPRNQCIRFELGKLIARLKSRCV
jgi:hypothetical protein